MIEPGTFSNTVMLVPNGLLSLGYVAFMALTQRTETEQLVTVHREGTAIAIVAAPGWTEQDWDRGVPKDLQEQYVEAWDYRVIDGYEVWIVDTKKVDRP